MNYDFQDTPYNVDMSADDTRRVVFMRGSNVGKTTVLYGDKVDQHNPQMATYVEAMAHYLQTRMGDTRPSDHLRMLWEVKQKPVNSLPGITLMTMNVRAALGEWA